MREVLGILAARGLAALLDGQIPAETAVFSYQDFACLRPRYGDSSWRVTLGKLVERRWVVKTYRDRRTAFQLTRQGWEELRQLYPVFSRSGGQDWTIAVYLPSAPKKGAAGAVRRALEQAGYEVIFPGLAAKPDEAYSDYLAQEIRHWGYQATFLPHQAGQAKPIPLGELFLRSERSQRLARECEKISRNCKTLLTELVEVKRLKNQTKERIGTLLVSGLAFFSVLHWYDRDFGVNGEAIRFLAADLDALLQEYSEKNSA